MYRGLELDDWRLITARLRMGFWVIAERGVWVQAGCWLFWAVVEPKLNLKGSPECGELIRANREWNHMQNSQMGFSTEQKMKIDVWFRLLQGDLCKWPMSLSTFMLVCGYMLITMWSCPVVLYVMPFFWRQTYLSFKFFLIFVYSLTSISVVILFQESADICEFSYLLYYYCFYAMKKS